MCVGIFGILSIPCLAIEPIYIVTSSGRFPAVASGNTLPLPGPFTRVLLEPQRRLLASPHHSRREVVVALWPKRRAPAIAGRRRRFVYRPTTEPRDLLGVEPTALVGNITGIRYCYIYTDGPYIFFRSEDYPVRIRQGYVAPEFPEDPDLMLRPQG